MSADTCLLFDQAITALDQLFQAPGETCRRSAIDDIVIKLTVRLRYSRIAISRQQPPASRQCRLAVIMSVGVAYRDAPAGTIPNMPTAVLPTVPPYCF